MPDFKLGTKSLKELDGVHADLVAVVKRAIQLTVQDFSVHDGIEELANMISLCISTESMTL